MLVQKNSILCNKGQQSTKCFDAAILYELNEIRYVEDNHPNK